MESMSAISRLLPLLPFGLDQGLGPTVSTSSVSSIWNKKSVTVVSGLELWQQTLTVQLPELRWRMEYLDLVFVPPFCYILSLPKIILIWRQNSQRFNARSSRESSHTYQSSQEIRRVRRPFLIRPAPTLDYQCVPIHWKTFINVSCENPS